MFENFKYKFFLKFFRNRKKLIWTIKNNLFANEVCPPSISIVKFSKNTILGKKNEKMYLVNDSFQSWNIINDQNYQNEFIKKIKSIINKKIKYDFVDIGANIGIMSKCLLNNKIKLSNTYCVEPNQENYFCLKNNLKDYKNIKYFNFALGTKKEDKKLFIDKNNMGNLSFYYEMVKRDKLGFMNSPDNYEIIKCESTQKFFKSIKLKKNIIKIDTQGYDEIIFQEIPKSVLKKNQILIIEITPISEKKINFSKYREKLNFYKKFTDFDGNIYSKDQVIKLSKKTKGKNIDLILLK
jgi:FkbM family methyltransferase